MDLEEIRDIILKKDMPTSDDLGITTYFTLINKIHILLHGTPYTPELISSYYKPTIKEFKTNDDNSQYFISLQSDAGIDNFYFSKEN